MPIYLDCNATSPIEPEVRDVVLQFMEQEFGNAGSRTHEFGLRAKQAVTEARQAVASVIQARPNEVIFTSGATEANNIALLGLARSGLTTSRRHLISSPIEHKAVLEPLQEMASMGFEISWLPVGSNGRVSERDVEAALRPDTLCVSVMHANNETGVLQPISEIADVLAGHAAYFHVDAAQTFGKELPTLRNPRIDLTSVSGHKVFGPKGIGALIARQRGLDRPPLQPLMFGGGQERGLRPGTLPVALIAGLGRTAKLALRDHAARTQKCAETRAQALAAFRVLNPTLVGDQHHVLPHVLNVAFPGADSEAVMLALRDLVAISNGSACTSSSYEPSHVLQAMRCPPGVVDGAVRISWCHLTPSVPWDAIAERILQLT